MGIYHKFAMGLYGFALDLYWAFTRALQRICESFQEFFIKEFILDIYLGFSKNL